MSAYLKASNSVTIGFLAAMAWHFGTVLGLFGTVPIGQADMMFRLAVIVGVVIAVALIAAFTAQKRYGVLLIPDGREEQIEHVSEGIGTVIIYAGLILLAWFAFTPLSPTQFVNGLLAVVSVAELAKLLIVAKLHGKKVGS